jgi:uncharacterized membrane protein
MLYPVVIHFNLWPVFGFSLLFVIVTCYLLFFIFYFHFLFLFFIFIYFLLAQHKQNMEEKKKKTVQNNVKAIKKEKQLFRKDNKQHIQLLKKIVKLKEKFEEKREEELQLSDGEGIKDEDLDFLKDLVFD